MQWFFKHVNCKSQKLARPDSSITALRYIKPGPGGLLAQRSRADPPVTPRKAGCNQHSQPPCLAGHCGPAHERYYANSQARTSCVPPRLVPCIICRHSTHRCLCTQTRNKSKRHIIHQTLTPNENASILCVHDWTGFTVCPWTMRPAHACNLCTLSFK